MWRILFTVLFILTATYTNAQDLNMFKHDAPVDVPEFRYADARGNIHSLKELRGKVIFLNLWSTWCKPCVEEMPALDYLYQALQSEGVVVLPVSMDVKPTEELQAFYDKIGITHLPLAREADQKLMKTFDIQALPTTIIINREGQEIARILGAPKWDVKGARSFIKENQ